MKAGLFFAAVLCWSAALAQTPNLEQCAGCHGANGEGTAQAPRIAGQPAPYIERQLNAYADGKRQHPVMGPIAKSVAPADRDKLAEHYANLQAPRGKPSASAGASAQRGNERAHTLATHGDESRQVQACANCHGPDGNGLAGVNPYLAGLDVNYLTNALQEWKNGTRTTDPSGQMSSIGKALSDADVKALAAYFAALPPPQRAAANQPASAGATQSTPQAEGTRREGVGVSGTEPATRGGSQGPGGAEPR
jgi:cytochrome c553